MLFSLFRKKPKDPVHYRTPEGACAYVVGDIHGCLDPLKRLLPRIVTRAATEHPELKTTLVFVGDLIDRGPASSQVVEMLRTLNLESIETVFLMGNHEEIFLDVLDGSERALMRWFEWGGRETARSYGVDNLGEMTMAPDRVLQRLIAQVPREHADFVRGFRPYYEFGDYVFVHAGLRPKVALASQTDKDLRWIREEFLNHKGDFPKKVVHGHSIVEKAEDLTNRIPVDTGVYKPGGSLTAAFLSGDTVEFLSEPTEPGA